ncbi:transcriptional regulator [Massilia sp. WF1]|uniref:GntR family transcriptional regulator n=1 Tax=unclassified Massilia TaxID=2609279 RepID=UPI0006924B01|nr:MULTISPECIES: FCD domain-containing protein [unclassified Massilia]ALK97912.1 transcriptional regulator [Massilia sp. WG5]KNZ67666.1 transcriptional regulator [Massilia sp. WF1]
MRKFEYAFTECPAQPRTLVEASYLRLRRDIIEGRLAPGTKLRVEHLKGDYGIGAGTLREALSLLLSDALVVSEGQRGFYVTPISLDDLGDITRQRILLECEALRQSIAEGDAAWEAGVVAAYHSLDQMERSRGSVKKDSAAEWDARNREFHEALIGACPSRWLRYMIGLLYRQAERYRYLTITHSARPGRVHDEHAAIFKSALERDVDGAVRALEAHIDANFSTVKAFCERHPWSP